MVQTKVMVANVSEINLLVLPFQLIFLLVLLSISMLLTKIIWNFKIYDKYTEDNAEKIKRFRRCVNNVENVKMVQYLSKLVFFSFVGAVKLHI